MGKDIWDTLNDNCSWLLKVSSGLTKVAFYFQLTKHIVCTFVTHMVFTQIHRFLLINNKIKFWTQWECSLDLLGFIFSTCNLTYMLSFLCKTVSSSVSCFLNVFKIIKSSDRNYLVSIICSCNVFKNLDFWEYPNSGVLAV